VNDLMAVLISKYNYWVYIILMMVGFYAIITKKNLVKKIIGLNIVQTAIILFYISIGAKKGATLPIIVHGHDAGMHSVHASDYINPLPHVLMLTAIVVMISTTGVGLAIVLRIYHAYGTVEEDELPAKEGG